MGSSTRAAVGAASIHAANLVEALSEALTGSDHDTKTPADVVALIDETLLQLHRIRAQAIGESRRRFDAAMERSATLLAESRKRRGPVR